MRCVLFACLLFSTGALADAIETLVQQPGLRKKMGVMSRELALQHYSKAKIVEAFFAIYGFAPEPAETLIKAAEKP